MKTVFAFAMIFGLSLLAQPSQADILTKKEISDTCFKLALKGQALEDFVEKAAGPGGAQLALEFTNRYVKCMQTVRHTGEIPYNLE